MTHKDRQGLLAQELERVIDYFRNEYDLTYADAVGVISILHFELCQECHERQEQGEESTDEECDSE